MYNKIQILRNCFALTGIVKTHLGFRIAER